jgi:L-ascorbate metabolism protein UlaG (beta-lactamase superfamily)
LILSTASGCGGSLSNVDGTRFPKPPVNEITFWGHATCYIDVDGFGIVTDPLFVTTALMKRRKIPIPPPSSYEDTRVILVSHAHTDHLNRESIETFPKGAVILCPEPVVEHLSDLDMEITAMKPGDIYEYPGGKICAVPADHPEGRYSLDSEVSGGALGFVIYTPQSTIYLSGDTDYFEGFNDIERQHRPDIAILNISGHLHGDAAARATWTLRVKMMIPVHWGAYGYLFIPQRSRPRGYDEMKELLGSTLILLEPGESMPLAGPAAGPSR